MAVSKIPSVHFLPGWLFVAFLFYLVHFLFYWKFSVAFNASKFACMFATKCRRGYSTLPEFQLDSKPLMFVT